ncbi:MAG: energy-coupling factor ABC transporter permease [Sideroxyarcus sp.]|nr:energy-coupling factor ABC transporter permease [Sideroxyarcus sp.]
MNLPAQLFSSDWLWMTNLLYAYFFYRAARNAPWRALLDNAVMVNALVGLLMFTFVFWQLNAGIRPGFSFHVLGSTLFMLMFGWQIAAVSITLVMLSTWLRTDTGLVTLGLNGLLMVAIPVLFSEWLLRFSKQHLPKNLALFVLWNGFACGAFVIVLNTLATSLLLMAFSSYTWPDIRMHYLFSAPLIAYVEGFTTGIMITAFTVFQPQAVMNFSDKEYLTGK